MSIAVIGPGAIGGTVAAWLGQTHAVTVCARTPVDALHVQTPAGAIEARPAVLTDPAEARPADWVLVCTKPMTRPAPAPGSADCAGVVSGLVMKPAGIAHDPAIAELMRGLHGVAAPLNALAVTLINAAR